MDISKMSSRQLVEYINKELIENKELSLTKACDKLKIKRSTVRSKLMKDGYSYDNEKRLYIKEEKNIDKDTIIKRETIKENSTMTKDEISEIRELLSMKNDLKILIQKYNNSTNNTNILSIDRKKFKGDIKPRLVKTYENINEEWIEFCKQHDQYKMQDLYSQALLEFMEKYK